RWRRPAAQSLAPIIPLHRARLRRCRLRWRARRRRDLGRPRDRAQGPRSNRLRRPAATLGCRALLRLDRAQQATGEGLRSHNSLRQSLSLRRLGHAPRASPRTISMSFKTDSEYLNESEAPNKTDAGGLHQCKLWPSPAETAGKINFGLRTHLCVPKTSSVFYCVTAARMPPFRFRVAGQNVSVHADPTVIRGISVNNSRGPCGS